MLASMITFALGIIMLTTMSVNQIYWSQTFVAASITSFGKDMSFPASVIVLSDSMSEEHQGQAASLVNTVINYSISTGLDMAGTVESHVNNGDTLRGYRDAWCFGIGLDASGMVLALCLVVTRRAILKAKAKGG